MSAASESYTETLTVTYADILAAAERLRDYTYHTPVHHSRSFDAEAEMVTWLKCEQFQRSGVFKFRGACNKIATLSTEERVRGVVTCSSGNHAQALALCAQSFGIPAICYMPADAPAVKVAATRSYGAEVIFYDRLTQDREVLASTLASERQMTLVPSSNDPAIIAGQGTAALELLEEIPDLDVLAVPVGGGGLIAGTGIVGRAMRPGIHVIGVETEAANHAYLSFQRGVRVSISPPDTIADGLRTTTLGALTWPIVQRTVDEIVLVSEEEVRVAMRFLLARLKLVVEPTGAVAAAAILTGKLRSYGKRVGTILSGGNVAPEVLREVLACE
ncbi:MAG: pyridoxal-phosphate dependent enzyme [Ktedonobacteraceae bacterium]